MPRPARPWFRFYTEAARDPKIRRLTPTQRWLWVAVLSAARESCIAGTLMVSGDVPYNVDDLADYAGMKVRDVTIGMERLIELGMVGNSRIPGAWSVLKWDDRQFETDGNVTERVRKHRAKERSSNADETLHRRYGVTPDTETETETDTERERTPRARARDPVEKTPIETPFCIPPDDQTWAETHYPSIDWRTETDKLVRWCKRNDTRYADWHQAWRLWITRAAELGR